MKKIQSLSLIALGAVMLAQCGKLQSTGNAMSTPQLPSTAPNYSVEMPPTVIDNTPAGNEITNDGAQLGRVLFYDKALSINNSTSCGSCHSQAAGFADPVAKSVGFEGGHTSRNSMSLVNASNEISYFWDGRTESLEQMVLQPVRHQVEMGIEKMELLPAKLSTISYYKPLFAKAFGSEEITKERIGLAMAQFLRSMSSYRAPADDANLANSWGADVNNVLQPNERRGASLFFNKAGCANCHAGTNFRGHGDHKVANIGLEVNTVDKGIMDVTGNPTDAGKFRVPSLRNIALTGPYMHDGRFATLRDVVNHYNSNVQRTSNLASELTNGWTDGGEPRQLNLTNSEIDDIVAFLGSLTDRNLVNDPKFADPFVVAK
jgi:cytochrome c peroxidase